MNNIIKFPTIAGVEIKTDDHGRFNLNALHKASGRGVNKAPAQWLRTKQAQELVELANNKTMQMCIVSLGGRNGGTFAHENLATEYAGWISTEFRWQVNQTFLDYRKGNLQPPAKLSRFDILKIAMEAEEENLKLSMQVKELTPQAEALERIATSDGSMCVTNSAKNLQMRPKDLFAWLSLHKWIYKRAGGPGWTAYQDRLQKGLLEHKVVVITRTDGSEKTTEQVRVTSKGLAKLADLIKLTA